MSDTEARKSWGELIRFLIVGGGFAVGYSVLVAMLTGPLGLPAYTTSVAVFALCIPSAFLAHKLFSFKKADTRKSGFLIYATAQIVSFASVSAITTGFVTDRPLVDTGVYLVTVGSAALITFAITRLFVFRRSDAATPRNAANARTPH